MDYKDSMFLFEIKVEELKSYLENQTFRIRSQFGDIFTLHLKDPNIVLPEGPPRIKKMKSKNKPKSVPTLQTCLITSHISTLALHMQKHPIYLCIWSKGNPYTLGSTYIPWSPRYLDYFESLRRNEFPDPVTVSGKYGIFNDYTSKKMATIALSIKLTRMNAGVPAKVEPFKNNAIRSSFDMYNDDPETDVSRYETGSVCDEIGTIKTIYSGGKRTFERKRKPKKLEKEIDEYNKGFKVNEDKLDNTYQSTGDTQGDALCETNDKTIESNGKMDNMYNTVSDAKPKKQNTTIKQVNNEIDKNTRKKNLDRLINKRKVKLIRSNTEIDIKQNSIIKCKSCSSIEIKERLDILDYIFGENNGPYSNQVYCVAYCAVQNDNTPGGSKTESPSPSAVKTSSKTSLKTSSKTSCDCTPIPSAQQSMKVDESEKHLIKVCDEHNLYSIDLPKVELRSLEGHKPGDLPKMAIRSLEDHNINVKNCTNILTCPHKRDHEPERPDDRLLINVQSLQGKCCEIQKVEEIVGGMQFNMNTENPCYCSCECKFGVIRKTTYCGVCGGYEIPGEAADGPPQTFPCPIFHKLERKDKKKDEKKKKLSNRDSETETEKSKQEGTENSKKKKKKGDDRFKFNYGYKAPQIGHSQCALPCTGTMGLVPKHMGWLWTAGNIPGLKFRPNWKPGAANKHVVRMLRDAQFPEQVLAKRRKKYTGPPKRPLKRPLLIVEKKDGEYTVTMETMKVFNKARLPNTYPYEDKPVVTFKIGRTEEENKMRARVKERAQKILEAEKRAFITNTFKNVCKDICTKVYQQALSTLPGDEDLPCPCLPIEPGPDRVDFELPCSCSDQSKESDATASDDDEWIVEFTPPNAIYNPTYQGKKIIKTERETQYTYLDYKVKLTDKYGNPVPRYFTGPNGKQECSDLGGFWGPDKKWLEINYDGYVAPDGRWAPNVFIFNGESVDAESGKFQTADGKWYIVGVDGYVENGVWKEYTTPKTNPDKLKKGHEKACDHTKPCALHKTCSKVQSNAGWSCFGDADPKELGKLGILGHGHDRQMLLKTLNAMMARGDNVIIPQASKVPHPKHTRKLGGQHPRFSEEIKCHHPPPSDKGVQYVDAYGNKKYFSYRVPKNTRPRDRMHVMENKGVSLSSFHVPCMTSFINSETTRQKNIEHILKHNERVNKS